MSDDTINGNAEGNPEILTNSPQLLSGRSLLQVHINSGKSLPKDGAKDFSPTNSWMEKKQIQCALDERKELLDEERVDKWGCLSGAMWDHKKKLAEVTRRAGKHFQTLGFEKEGTLYLYPEEALYLLETNSLELSFGGVSMSIQQGYSLLLGASTGCDLNEYRTYSHLMRQGYKLLRFTSQKVHTKYERAIRLDQHAPVKRSHPGQSDTGSKDASKAGNFTSAGTIKAESPPVESMKESDNIIKNEREEVSVSESSRAQSSSLHDSNLVKEAASLLKKEGEGTEQLLPTNKKHLSTQESTDQDCEASIDIASGAFCERSIGPSEESREDLENEVISGDKCATENQELLVDGRASSAEKDGSTNKDDKSADGEIGVQNQEPPDATARGDGSIASIEGVKTKAFGIAESLLSLGSALAGKEPSEDCSDDTNKSENLLVTLQSEIIKALGAHLKTGISEEDLAAVASSAASTILSHMSHNDDKNTVADDTCDGQLSKDDKCPLKSHADMDQPSEENNLSESTCNGCEQDSETMMSLPDSIPSPYNTKLVQHSQNFGQDSNDSASIVEYLSNDDNESEKVKISQDLKRPAPSDGETDDCEPVLIKKPKVRDIDEDVEILDFVPEKKQVELVNLSDESSMESAAASNINDGDGIEVIDVLDSSSSDSSESVTSSSGSDSSVIVEERERENWVQERRRILETFPSMHNITEITLAAPSSDLLPVNVTPQHNRYRINRWRLLEENRDIVVNPSYPQLPDQSLMRPGHPFQFAPQGTMPQPVWQPNMPINPVTAVQAIAQLVLPMLGLPPTAFPPEQVWMQNNPWFSPRPWGPRPRFNQHPPRGNNWQRSRSRPYLHRYAPRAPYTPRYQHYRRVPPFNHRHSPNILIQTKRNAASALNEPSKNEVVPFQSSEDFWETSPSNVTHETDQWSSWKQKNMQSSRGKPKPKKKGSTRYFNPPRKYTHIKSVLREKPQNEDSDESSEDRNSPNVKAESDSSDEDCESEHMDTNDTNQNDDNSSLHQDSETTDESCNSPMEVKPLLSPHNCTTFASVFKSVQVIKEANTQILVSTAYGTQLRPKFDLFSPSKPFKKGNPPLPDFHLCIMRYSDEVPAPGDIRALMNALDDAVPVMYAIVSPDSINFLQFCDVSLPSVPVD